MAEAIRTGCHTLFALCDALGITEKRVTSLVIRADLKNCATVTATMIMSIPGTEKVCEVIRQYELHEIEPSEPEEYCTTKPPPGHPSIQFNRLANDPINSEKPKVKMGPVLMGPPSTRFWPGDGGPKQSEPASEPPVRFREFT